MLKSFRSAYLLMVGLAISCGGKQQNDTQDAEHLSKANSFESIDLEENIYTGNLADGQKLAKQYCSSCHQYPEPQLLDKATWETYILPRMGYMMGVYQNDRQREELIEQGEATQRVILADIFPQTPRIDRESWKAIQQFYLDQAPQKLTATSFNNNVNVQSKRFEVNLSPYRLSPPSSTYVSFKDNQQLWVGDAHTQSLYIFDNQLKLSRVARIKEGLTHMHEDSEHLWLTLMGSFSPTDAASGMLLRLPKIAGQQPKPVISKLRRPVHSSFADINLDGKEDVVICEYAKWTGVLSWWEQQENKYVQHVLKAKAGAIKSYVRDVNNDGRPDIMALFGQGDEGISLFVNLGKGQFEEKILFSFPPSYGSSDFLLFDWNRDGREDIIYTAGDNADYPPINKPYHGIRIFEHTGDYGFEEVMFYPLPGAYKAVPADLDVDGDLDIAAISFFPDFSTSPHRGFVWLENKGGDQFQEHHIQESINGRWISMDVADWDQDGDEDIVLGSLAFEAPGYEAIVNQWINGGIPFIILENKTR